MKALNDVSSGAESLSTPGMSLYTRMMATRVQDSSGRTKGPPPAVDAGVV